MHKKLIFWVIIVIMLSAPGVTRATGTGIDLQYWYSDSHICFVWPINIIPTHFSTNPSVPLPNLSIGNLQGYVATGYVRWSPALKGKAWSIASTTTSSPSMRIQPKTISELQIPNYYDGLTIVPWSSVDYLIAGYYGAQTKDIYIITGPVYVHPVYNSVSAGYSIDKWKIIMTHEMGHAFGYWGHYNSGAVMKPSNVTTTYPNTNEFRHLGQLN